MTEPSRDPAIRGKIIQFTWTEGPTKGTTHEHVFHPNGTVEWREAKASKPAGPDSSAGRVDRPPYAAIKIAEQVYLISYLAESGYTLTVVLNFDNRQLAGFASSARDWHPLRGTFELVK